MATILIVEDEPKMLRLLELNLREEGYTTYSASNAETALNLLRQEKVDLVVTDLRLPGMDGLEFLQAAKRVNAALPVIVMTAYGTVETAVEPMKAGAIDYMLKPFPLVEVTLMNRKELDVHQLRKETRLLREALGQLYEFKNSIARRPNMQEVLSMVERIGPRNSTVLLGGESGVGKDLIARAIHQHSRRASGPFVKINSTAIPENLLESELFGYDKGAFTGAVTSKPGKFELADKGTVFLDEIGDVPPATQVKLLRVLQEREFERLGGTKTLKVDVRLIAATNRDLRAALEQGAFREDLYYRLNVVPINIAPLRERREDIPYLVDHFVARFARESGKPLCGITPAAMQLLVDFHWPGNVRELENILERAVALSAEAVLDVGDIQLDLSPSKPPRLVTGRAGANSTSPNTTGSAPAFLPDGMTLEQYEDELIREALRRAASNKSQAARLLGLSRNALRYRLSRMGVPDEGEADK